MTVLLECLTVLLESIAFKLVIEREWGDVCPKCLILDPLLQSSKFPHFSKIIELTFNILAFYKVLIITTVCG